MNITEHFRRKNKYHKPILVFKELYRDYYQQSPRSPIKEIQKLNQSQKLQNTNTLMALDYTIDNKNINYLQKGLLNNKKAQCLNSFQEVSKLTKTKSAENMTKYLEKHGQNISSNAFNMNQPSSILRDQSILRKSKSTKNNTYVFRLLDRTQLQTLQKDKQAYFKSTYTKQHPFFRKNSNKIHEKFIDEKENKIPQILPEIFKQTNSKLKMPIERRQQLQELKSTLNERKNLAVQKFSKMRYNYLVKKNFTKQNDSNIALQSFNKTKCFSTSKQNIFPTIEQ